jgi:hypothetical protein
MARTKQTARKSVTRTSPPVSDESSSSEKGTKRPLDTPDPSPRPVKKAALGCDMLLRNKIHFRMHSIADLVTAHKPSMQENAELMDRAIERAKHQLIEELEQMLVDDI